MNRRGYTALVAVALSCAPAKDTKSPVTSMETKKEAPFHTLWLENLKEGESYQGFQAEALYLNDAEEPFGARFVHTRTGFVLDLLQIQSVPQAFLWVNTFPTSDKGEPHTQEHLLLGKGNVGRAMASLESMSLADSSAFTQQWRTAYHFHTTAGPEVFFTLFERQMDALLHPDYTDEEIRREVRNWGVTEDPATGALRLEEKGTVYQEMVSSFDRPINRLFRVVGHMLYGEAHPLSYSSGGWPEAIRAMKPEDIRKFHSENYHLGNMGMVASFPKEMALGDSLRRLDEIFGRLEPGEEKRDFFSVSDIPPPKMTPEGEIRVVTYPHENEKQPGWVLFAWPATLSLDLRDEVLLELFLSAIAGDATTNLYKLFVDSQTRVMDVGAKGVFAFLDDEQVVGHPVYIGLRDVSPEHMTEEKIALIRQKILEEMKRIASLPDGSSELRELSARIKSRIIQTRRGLSKFVDSPPGFGFRGTGSDWMTHLDKLHRKEGFQKSVTLKDDLAAIEKLIEGEKNIWKGYLKRWGLTEAVPYGVAALPDPKLIKQGEEERQARAKEELLRLMTKYGLSDAQEALRRYKEEYDATTAELERLEKEAPSLRFVEDPPLSLDEQLDYKVTTRVGVPIVSSTFDTMSSATVGLALRLDGIPEEDLVYVTMLPSLLTRVGVIQDGKALSYEEMSERLRQEILALNTYISTDFRSNRVELVVRGAGNNIAESKRALAWMELVLKSPDWRPENLPRIRDVVEQALGGLRNRTQGPEETWVNNPADAYWRQDNPLLLATSSFLTQTHNVHRLRWMLKDAGEGEAREEIARYLETLAVAAKEAKRAELRALLDAMQGDKEAVGKVPTGIKPHLSSFEELPAEAKEIAVEAAKDLALSLADIPDATLASDWAYLVRQMRHDLLISPIDTLKKFDALREGLFKTGNARLFLIGSRASQEALSEDIDRLLSGLVEAKATKASYSSLRRIEARLMSRLGKEEKPVFVGLVNPNTQGGVFLHSAPAASYLDTDREALLDYLASLLYAGHGAHGIFIKTWGAGLAYSNGLRGSPSLGRIRYYAERTPDLPQTLRFVIEELKKAKPDPGLVEYAIAMAFSESRAASSYEGRGEAMAEDLADGIPPEVVKRFRSALLELRKSPDLAEELFRRMGAVYAKVLPGYGMKAKDVEGGVYYVIGPEKQLASYEEYLKSVEGPETKLYRLYPRDYWMPLTTAEVEERP